jgi:hypothetical protein
MEDEVKFLSWWLAWSKFRGSRLRLLDCLVDLAQSNPQLVKVSDQGLADTLTLGECHVSHVRVEIVDGSRRPGQ